ncbi:gluconate 2-dehydrogenase subunit 3 family protein [Fulvivirga sp. 29W222]|uniref:Gluconate 2-dehydrogenase subunit 3 family protein n=1 Tax=Fulvivirga marina TaxID=2494733 RepID=A0A937KAN7_9BACT|nr:gluconate 2-dehydrogenase subunit 3 family protein [Fulvivirga marina]MBL6444797.1 gluconate 2-dehydrogenase subunit 3 family protein [Fulvivirga marina]
MNRREALKAVSVIMGGTVISANTFLSGCSVEKDERVNSLFMESDVALLDEIGEAIIPTTDTPGAKAVGIGGFITMMVLDCYEPKHQNIFTQGLVSFKESFNKQYDHGFIKAKSEERIAFLTELDKAQRESSLKNKDNPDAVPHYFRMIKELTLLGYFTSEIGCTQVRRYVETPGRYEACIDYKAGDGAWAI